MTVTKTSIVADNSLLVATEVKNASDVTTATNSNRDNIRHGYSSISSNDTHVGFLGEKIAAGSGIILTEVDDAADESLAIINTEHKPQLVRVDNDTLVVGTGANDTQTIMELATAGNWIGGSSLESASELVHVYEVLATPGTYKLSDKQPQYTAPAVANRIADMQVNQAGWDGTAAQGLNATSVVYDNGTDGDDVLVGNYAIIYDDASFTLGRGRGSGAATAVGNLSVAKITATTAGAATGTLTLEAGHQIAINDDDYIIVVDAGKLEYRYDGGAWYKHIGAWFNDSGGNLLDLTTQYGNHRQYNSDNYIANEGADYTTASTTFVDVDATNFSLTITTNGGDVMIGFHGTGSVNNVNNIYMNIARDGVGLVGDEGMMAETSSIANHLSNLSFLHVVANVLPGTHTFNLQWRVNADTGKMFAGAGTSTDTHPEFWVKEVA